MIYEIIDDANGELIPHIRHIARQAYGRDPWTEQQYDEDRKNQFTAYLGAFDRGYLIGYIHYSVIDKQGEILNLAVHPAYQKQGIAKQLIKQLWQRFTAISWLLEVRASNAIAKRLYQAAGFEAISIRKDYYQHPVEDAIVMQYQTEQVKL